MTVLIVPAVLPAERVLDEEGALVESAQAERAEAPPGAALLVAKQWKRRLWVVVCS